MSDTNQPADTLPDPMFHEPIFSEGTAEPDPAGFLEPHPSDNAVYRQINKLLSTQVVSFPQSRAPDDSVFSMADAYGARGPGIASAITKAGGIVFHATGDSGATTAGRQYSAELSVADQMSADCNRNSDVSNRPAFLLHLGDVVYNFGESQYYYDQFYDPFRNYPAPIFALAGNHDSFVVPGTPKGEEPLTIFQRNFCAESPVITPEAGSLHRTAMTQPGVYFGLDAPFVRVICLFSNALEDPGVISPEGRRWSAVPNYQLAFLEAQLTKIKKQKYAGAVLLAVHHPPFSYAAKPRTGRAGVVHGGSPGMLREIDKVCAKVGVYPHAVISGHAHNYQRYTRTIRMGRNSYEVPFIISGSGGHHINNLVYARGGAPAHEPHFGTDVSYLDVKPAIPSDGLMLEKYNDRGYGYLRISADANQLGIGYHVAGTPLPQSRFDKVTVDLATHKLAAN